MEFKKVFYPILLGLILISSLYVLVADFGNISESGTNVSISSINALLGDNDPETNGNGSVYDIVHKNGTVARYNFTISLDVDDVNITIINITTDYNLTWAVPGNADVNGTSFNASFGGLEGIDGFFNQTNISIADHDVWVVNQTDVAVDGKDDAQQMDGIMFNITGSNVGDVVVSFNVTARVSDADSDYRTAGGRNVDLLAMIWEVGVNMTNGTMTKVNLTTYVDVAPPRLGSGSLNITDGNTTIEYYNYSGQKTVGLANLNGTALIGNSSLTVRMTINETNMDGLNMYYYCQSGLDHDNDIANLSTNYENVSMTTADVVSPYLYSGSINSGCFNDSAMNVSILFMARDKAGWNRNITFGSTVDYLDLVASAQDEDVHQFLFQANDSAPVIRLINISDAVNTGATRTNTLLAGRGNLNGNGDFVGSNKMLTVIVEVAGKDLKNVSQLIYSVNSSTILDIRDDILFQEGIRVTLTNITDSDSAGVVRYNGTIGVNGYGRFNDTELNTTVNFLILVNASDNGTAQYRFRGAFGVDGESPTSTITAPSDTTIDVQHAITYKCSGSDGTGSGVYSCDLKFTKPDGATVTYATCSNKEISGEATGQAGTYTVDCTTTDSAGNTKSATSKTFLVLNTGVSAPTSSGGGGGTSGTAVQVDIDLTTAESATVSGYKGNTKSFTFGGASHTITVTDVSETSATITIESSPVVVSLNIGETKQVDINNDGTPDLELTLNKISQSKADITMKKLAEGASKVVEEEKAAEAAAEEEMPGEGEVTEEEETPVVEESKGLSTGVIATIIAVIVIIGIVAYVLIRRRS